MGKTVKIIKTYIDSGVLIQAYRGATIIGIKAREILEDPQREYVASLFIKFTPLS